MKKIAKFSAFMVAAMFAATSFTSCGEDDPANPNGGGDEALAEKVNFDGLKAIANSNGTIDIVGEITADKKLKSFVLINVETNEETSLGDKNTTTKEKEVDENGKKVKKFTMTVTGANVPVGIYKFTTIANDWTIFDNFHLYYLGAETPTGIDSPQAVNGGTQVANAEFYNLSGARIATPTKGVNIMRQRMADGTVRTVKVLVK